MENVTRFTNYYFYRHEDSLESGQPPVAWEDQWSCQCNDRCLDAHPGSSHPGPGSYADVQTATGCPQHTTWCNRTDTSPINHSLLDCPHSPGSNNN
jgi:hypothetical protein